MSTVTELEAIRTQLAELAKQVTKLTEFKMYADTFLTVGRMEGAKDARAELLGRTAETSCSPRPRPDHLQVVDGGAS